MKVNLTQALIWSLPVENADVYDAVQPSLVLRTRASGHHSFRVALKHGRWYTLGSPNVLTPAAARELARQVLGEVAHGKDPQAEKRKARSATFDQFLKQQYEPWALAHLKTGAGFVARIRAQFSPLFGNKPLTDITPWAVEKWRAGRLRGDHAVKPGTVNRDLVALKACLSKAVQWRVVADHPPARGQAVEGRHDGRGPLPDRGRGGAAVRGPDGPGQREA